MAFLERVLALAKSGASDDDLITLIYSSENPILAPYPFGGRGMVTKETLEDPLYHIMSDLLFRARLARGGKTVEDYLERFTLGVTEAAKRLGISRSALHKAIQERRIDSCRKAGSYYLTPNDVDRFATNLPETRRGMAPQKPGPGAPLEVRIGTNPAVQFALKAPKELTVLEHDGGRAVKGVLRAGWASIAVGYQSRLNEKQEEGIWLLVPSDKESALELAEFYVRGRFKVKQKQTGKTTVNRFHDFKCT